MSTVDAIIILSGSNDYPSKNRDRFMHGMELYEKLSAQKIIVAGGYSYKEDGVPEKSEAEVIKHILIELGQDEDTIILEQDSQETVGNLLFTKQKILEPNNWHRVVIVPSYTHSVERVEYVAQKVLGQGYEYEVSQLEASSAPSNIEREKKSLKYTKMILSKISDGDDEAVWRVLQRNHPAYGENTKYTLEELKRELS